MDIKVSTSYIKEMRRFINLIKRMVLNNGGIIYGGLVRDEIIGNHYREKFIKKNLDFDKYYDMTYDIETNKRLILPSDIDVFFKTNANVDEFFKNVKNVLIEPYFGQMKIKTNTRTQNMFNYISSFLKLKHNKVQISIVIGKTLTSCGTTLKLLMDILTVNTELIVNDRSSEMYMSDIEPPFYNIDFLCNSFILEYSNKRTNIRISNCTGTKIDNMEFTKKMYFANTILKDIVNNRTQFIRNDSNFNAELINCYRIIKLIQKPFSWNITNIPFHIFKSDEITNDIEETCLICMDEIKLLMEKKEQYNGISKYISITTTSKNQILHYKCFCSYIDKEQNKRYINADTGKIECRCPLRIPFNFNECYKSVDFDLD